MQKPILTLLLATFGFSAVIHAQITVTNATFPAVNDTVFYAVDANSNPIIQIFTPPGGNQNWNLSGLQLNQTGSTVYRNPNTGAQSANFPGAELLVVEAGREMYYNVTGNRVELMGYYGIDPVGIGINLLIPYNPPYVKRRAPVNFFDINQASSGVLVPFSQAQVPANLLQLFPAQADSFRIRIAVNRLDVVDAWGTLSIPGGCYPVLREKRTQYEEKRLDAKVPPLGWLDVTDVAIQTWGLQLGVDTIVQHHFFSTVDKQEIAVVRLNNAQNAAEFIRFKYPDNSLFSIANIATTPESCPNAGNGSITITANPGAGTLTYAISGPANQSNSTGVFTGLPGGNYNITVTSSISPCPVAATATVAAGVDTELPAATCANATLNFNGQQSIALDANELVMAADNCGVQSVTLSPNTIFATQVGQTVPVTATVTDVNSNVTTCTANIAVSGLPAGWSQEPDGIGCTNCSSEFNYSPGTGIWTAGSSGAFYSSPYTSDAIALASRTLCGNGSITARVTGIDGNGWAGVVMRESNAPGAKKAQLMTNLSQFNRREFRTATNGQAFPQQFPSQSRYWLRIVRSGQQFSMYVSPNGMAWYLAGVQSIPMNTCISAGLAATNYTSTGPITATFSNVDFMGSNVTLSAPVAQAGVQAVLEQLDFSVYPNPTSGELHVDMGQYAGRSVRLEVYSLEGKLLQFSEIDEVQSTVETLNLTAYHYGMYMIKVKSEGLPDATRRVVVAR